MIRNRLVSVSAVTSALLVVTACGGPTPEAGAPPQPTPSATTPALELSDREACTRAVRSAMAAARLVRALRDDQYDVSTMDAAALEQAITEMKTVLPHLPEEAATDALAAIIGPLEELATMVGSGGGGTFTPSASYVQANADIFTICVRYTTDRTS
ncbi:hypothetical protein [Plantactinospora sonchi]|uniref:Lipoprotein n=1 Tax=Plantactinospora sonchi TaxID=1544735 RepID=A0ABU7RZM6_9ACTN